MKMPGGPPLIARPASGIQRPGENSPARRGVVPLGPLAAAPISSDACCPIPAVDWRPVNQVRCTCVLYASPPRCTTKAAAPVSSDPCCPIPA